MQRTAPTGELARIRAVLAFARATQAPPEAVAWLLRLSRQAEARRGDDAAPVMPTLLAAPPAPDVLS